ncbi:MAG: hypothetical protein ABI977_16265 [Acidobacteriota bacterium]
MQAWRTLTPGQEGTKKVPDHYGEKLIYVRYRYYEQRRKRVTTVEIIVEESAWTPPSAPITEPLIVGLRIGINEVNVQRRIKQAGGKWNRQQQLWEIPSDQAIALGLKDRIQNLEVSTIRHQSTTDEQAVEVFNRRR